MKVHSVKQFHQEIPLISRFHYFYIRINSGNRIGQFEKEAMEDWISIDETSHHLKANGLKDSLRIISK